MRLHVDVTEEDIRLGKPKIPTSCMVARAIVRCSEGALKPYVSVDHVRFNRVRISLAPEVATKILSWDRGLPVSPFSFDLELPE